MRALPYLLLSAAAVEAHYTFPQLLAGGKATGEWVNVIKTTHWQNNGFVGDVKSEGIRCDALSMGSATTINVTAGSTIGFSASPNIYHPGPVQMYMARVPEGKTAKTWDGSGSVWFKVYQEQPNFGAQLTWPSTNKATQSVTVPRCLKSGEYLFRIEHIALHSAGSSGGAQFYISCGQISLSGGGNTEGGPTVAFPGAYSASDPGILININYPVPTSYVNPGPKVFTC
ncbi:Glycoside hydrolase, family 61 [Coniochaeta hoffmannii]|uniref:lytic cellulose monooxygenase (C4-dehydrogenating) n=1 Tax=Coniochaeta hoffmannii TaxID=91930 RepID=A0AA38S2X6_9PEZI|nr:Glycoside hydrolase, family 61 [Coniochaeta hoffmannii]